jgi:hypothetical protein
VAKLDAGRYVIGDSCGIASTPDLSTSAAMTSLEALAVSSMSSLVTNHMMPGCARALPMRPGAAAIARAQYRSLQTARVEGHGKPRWRRRRSVEGRRASTRLHESPPYRREFHMAQNVRPYSPIGSLG